MPSLDQRVCNCRHHADGDEDCGECCNYVAQCERDALRAQVAELTRERAEVWRSAKRDRGRAEQAEARLAEAQRSYSLLAEEHNGQQDRADKLEDKLAAVVEACDEIAPAQRDDGSIPDDSLVNEYRLARRIRAALAAAKGGHDAE